MRCVSSLCASVDSRTSYSTSVQASSSQDCCTPQFQQVVSSAGLQVQDASLELYRKEAVMESMPNNLLIAKLENIYHCSVRSYGMVRQACVYDADGYSNQLFQGVLIR